jgi:mannose-6-phosphate isomerase-like protein (cupin superfamily)
VLQARNTALLVSSAGIHVARRGDDGAWRVAICLLRSPENPKHTGGRMSQPTQVLEPVATRSGEGEARWWFACLAEIKVTAEQTNGLLSILEITEGPNQQAPLHVHHREDETFVVLEGDLTFTASGRTVPAGAGAVLYVPKGTVHSFANVGTTPARMLFLYTPAGMDEMFAEIDTPTRPGEAAPPPGPEDVAKLLAVAAKYGFEILPPPGQ